MAIYSQLGQLTLSNGQTYPAYSGHGPGLDNGALEAVPNVGPIPKGEWRVVEWVDNYENKGSVVARLAPAGFNPHGRSGFLCHGDNALMNHTASDGCIVAAHDIRTIWRDSGDMNLTVTE